MLSKRKSCGEFVLAGTASFSAGLNRRRRKFTSILHCTEMKLLTSMEGRERMSMHDSSAFSSMESQQSFALQFVTSARANRFSPITVNPHGCLGIVIVIAASPQMSTTSIVPPRSARPLTSYSESRSLAGPQPSPPRRLSSTLTAFLLSLRPAGRPAPTRHNICPCFPSPASKEAGSFHATPPHPPQLWTLQGPRTPRRPASFARGFRLPVPPSRAPGRGLRTSDPLRSGRN